MTFAHILILEEIKLIGRGSREHGMCGMKSAKCRTGKFGDKIRDRY